MPFQLDVDEFDERCLESIHREQITPIEKRGPFFVKRDDLWKEFDFTAGGKSRTASLVCKEIVRRGGKGACICIARNSSIPFMMSKMCRHYGIEFHAFLPTGELGEIFDRAKEVGGYVHQIKHGYMTVLKTQMRKFMAERKGMFEIGLGLEFLNCGGILSTSYQTQNVPSHIKRVVCPVGSGQMFQGVLYGLSKLSDPPEAIGVVVAKPPKISLPPFARLVQSRDDFKQDVFVSLSPLFGRTEELPLDPTYEGKCMEFLKEGDLLWVVCHRNTE